MAQLRVNPTRMELKRIRARYDTARRGHKLLKDKRDELMKKFLDIVREDKVLRERVEAGLAGVYRSFAAASAVIGRQMLVEALIMPGREVALDVEYRNLMSVTVPEFEAEILGDGGAAVFNYGLAFTSGELDASLRELAALLPDLVRMAELEKAVQLLAAEIEKTRRRVNALEYIIIPQYLETMKSIRMKLEENERGNTTRLMKVKDMMIEKKLMSKRKEAEAE
ncbi:MAG TPA: V-type ATP synthase subunit D [Clostridiales bacterium]|nr:V-type ATP synthase subunit D [Clostridiales bacterium]